MGGHRDNYGGGPMRGGRMGHRPGPYDRRPPPGMDRYGPPGPPPPPIRNGFYGDEFDPRDRRPLPPPMPVERRPLPPPMRGDPFREYDRMEYDRMPAPAMGRRSPLSMDRRPPPPVGYGRREDPYDDMYPPRE